MPTMPDPVVFLDLPGILGVEESMGVRGIEWNEAFQTRCDQVSRSLFGITERDTRLERPDRHTYDAPEGLAAHLFDTDDLANYDAALDAWGYWDDRLSAAADIGSEGGLVLIGNILLDLTGEGGGSVKCFRLFARQCMVAGHQLDPRAKFTPDASSSSAQSAVAWGNALEAEAARFKSHRV